MGSSGSRATCTPTLPTPMESLPPRNAWTDTARRDTTSFASRTTTRSPAQAACPHPMDWCSSRAQNCIRTIPSGAKRHHFLCLNLQEDIDSVNMPPQHVIDEVRRQGGCGLVGPSLLELDQRDAGCPSAAWFRRCRSLQHHLSLSGEGESPVLIGTTGWSRKTGSIPPWPTTTRMPWRGSRKTPTRPGPWLGSRNAAPSPIVDALVKGATYCTTGPQIHDISLRRLDSPDGDRQLIEATISCSKAQRILAVSDTFGREFRIPGETFEKATFTVHPISRWVRFEVHAPDGSKAWSNPFDLR